jgi:alkylation response protein AidB-like acyl-CoA dehydrogenase
VATGGELFPRGTASPVEGGYRVTARWPFGSGSGHAKWLLGGSLVSPTEGSDERPQARMFFFPREEVTIHDTWQVSGLRGTGSNDFEVTGQFVPARRTCPIGGGKVWASGPLYRFPLYGLLALGVASVSLGIARAAIDELHELATAKTPTGSTRLLAERASAQSGLAEAEALLRSARAFMRETVTTAQARAESGDRLTLNERALLRLSATTAAQNCARAVDICYNLGGASSIYAQNPLQRHFRDVHTVTQHVMVGQPTLEVAGRVFLDIPTDTTMF